jgi:hypothetical protein
LDHPNGINPRLEPVQSPANRIKEESIMQVQVHNMDGTKSIAKETLSRLWRDEAPYAAVRQPYYDPEDTFRIYFNDEKYLLIERVPDCDPDGLTFVDSFDYLGDALVCVGNILQDAEFSS